MRKSSFLLLRLSPELTSRLSSFSSHSELRRSEVEGLADFFSCGSVLPNTGLVDDLWFSSTRPGSRLLWNDNSIEVGRILGFLGLSGNTGLFEPQDLAEEDKLSWEENINSVFSEWWCLQALGDVTCCTCPLSTCSVPENTGLLGHDTGLLWGNVGLLGSVKVQLSWEHKTKPELRQVSTTSWLSRLMWTVALLPVCEHTGDFWSWKSSIWVESELWFVKRGKQKRRSQTSSA